MSFAGLLKRGVQRLRSVGVRRFSSFLADRYIRPVAEQYIFGHRERSYRLGDRFQVSIPVFTRQELANVVNDLRLLGAETGGMGDIDAYLVVLKSDNGGSIDIPDLGFPIHVDEVETPRLVLSLVLWTGNIYIPGYADTARSDELKETLRRLGTGAMTSKAELVDAYHNRRRLELKGSGIHTRFLYKNLRENLDGPHYGFREDIDLDIVKELPRKFKYFAQNCEINFLPIRDLNKYPGRVSRQYVVGEMYQNPYFMTDSVLDVGCDIRGISEFVGPNTKYVGADIQGLGDYQIDLDNEELPFDSREFDTVLCFEVLEHLNKIHQCFDKMLDITDKYFIGSLFVESGVWKGKSVSRFGDPLGNMYLPIAPIFDRHEWVFSITDALDFIYYRAKRSGFRIVRLDIFYDDARLKLMQLSRLKRAFRRGSVGYLAKEVLMVAFVIERISSDQLETSA